MAFTPIFKLLLNLHKWARTSNAMLPRIEGGIFFKFKAIICIKIFSLTPTITNATVHLLLMFAKTQIVRRNFTVRKTHSTVWNNPTDYMKQIRVLLGTFNARRVAVLIKLAQMDWSSIQMPGFVIMHQNAKRRNQKNAL